MIEHIEIENFKSLQRVSLDLGPLNIFVGTNASGKTNFLEALRVLQGMFRAYTVDEVFNRKQRSASGEVWQGIRGGSEFGPSIGQDIIHLRVTFSLPEPPRKGQYSISLSPSQGLVHAEKLLVDGVTYLDETIDGQGDKSRSALFQFAMDRGVSDLFEGVRRELSDMQLFEPVAANLRAYSAPAALRLGDHGEDFAGVVDSILSTSKKGSDYVAWLKELTPRELDGAKALKGAKNDRLFAVTRNGIDYPADILSDGTLRFAAIAAAFFQPDPPKLLLLEEVEDSLHPTRLQLLVELLKSQAGRSAEQVIATTHSPYVIAWLNEADYRSVFLFTKDEETGGTTITPFTEVPHLLEVARRHPISDMFVEGWLETAV